MHPDRISPTPVLFSEDYYRSVIAEHRYSPFEFAQFDFNLAGLAAAELNLRLLCHHRAQAFAATASGSRIITTGFGMSGEPHLGTVAQLLAAIRFQSAGETVQLVLGDLDAHNGKGKPLARTRELAAHYAAFCRRLGFDETAGVLRDQHDDLDALRAMYLLGFYADDADFARAEEDNHGYYASMGIVDDQMTFRRKISLALMAADFVSLGQRYDSVLVMLGVDEHKYVRFARDMAGRLDDSSNLRGGFELAAVYSRLLAGFGGHPKMSKSIPGSSINVLTSADEVARLIRDDTIRRPETSPTYQLICQLFLRPFEECLTLADACANDTPAWSRAKAELIEYVVSVTRLW